MVYNTRMKLNTIICAAAVCGCVSLTAYVAYSDYWFDRKLRHGAREYNGSWGNSDKYANSWNFYGGVGVTLSF